MSPEHIDQALTVGVQIAALEDSDDRELAQLATRLRSELLATDADRVDPVRTGDAPPGTKGLEVLALGHLVVQVASIPALRRVVAALRDYVARQPVRSVKLTIDGDVLEVTAVSDE